MTTFGRERRLAALSIRDIDMTNRSDFLELRAHMRREGNQLRVLRLGGNGPWAEGAALELGEALASATCAIQELDLRGASLADARQLAALLAGSRVRTLSIEEWAMPLYELRTTEALALPKG